MTMRMLPFESAIADPNPARTVDACPWCGATHANEAECLACGHVIAILRCWEEST